jgi:predicted acetyltransferase
MLRRENDQHTYIAVYFDEQDQPTGYCLYRTRWQQPDSPEPSHRIDVFDLSWLNIEAYRGLWEYLAGHDLANRICVQHVPEDDPAPNMLQEPRMLQRRTWDGVWLRVVDAEQALARRGYDTGGEATLQVVDDDICAWNNACYRLNTSDAATEVERLTGNPEPDIVARPDALASLISGHSKVSDLARMGRLSINDDARAVALDHLFSTRQRPVCPNMF